MVVPFFWRSGCLHVLDQRLLPLQTKYLLCRTPDEVAEAIRGMAVRGAPAIGCVAAYGMALAVKSSPRNSRSVLRAAARLLISARPTAVNLAWAVKRMLAKAEERRPMYEGKAWSLLSGSRALFENLLSEAHFIAEEDIQINHSMGRHGARLFKKKSTVLTHCNAGALATAGYGTALGVIREAARLGKIKKVFVDETRPYLQGARLTSWELVHEKIPHELITDSMAGFFMKTEKVNAVIVGCDRVAANGDAANKIGTYSLAVLARYHRIPFYVAMPFSTFDSSIHSGADIPIEERSSDEVVCIKGIRIAPKETRARHPAFDVTPAELITAIVTEKGIVRPPYLKNLERLKKS